MAQQSENHEICKGQQVKQDEEIKIEDNAGVGQFGSQLDAGCLRDQSNATVNGQAVEKRELEYLKLNSNKEYAI